MGRRSQKGKSVWSHLLQSSAQCSVIVLKGPAQLALCLFMDLCYRKRKLVGVSQPVNNREKGAGQRD